METHGNNAGEKLAAQEAATRQLAELVSKRLQVAEMLYEISERQADVVQSGDTTRLLRLLLAKQKLISRLEAIEQALEPFRRQSPEARRWASAEARDACRREAERSETLLAEVRKREIEATEQFTKRREELREALAALPAQHTAQRAYLDGHTPAPCRLDLKSE